MGFCGTLSAQLFFKVGGSTEDVGRDVVKASNNEKYVVTTFTGSSPIDFEPTSNDRFLNANGSKEDIALVKYDNGGNVVWINHIGNIGSDVAHCVKLDNSGGVYIVGYFEGIVDFDPDDMVTNNLTSSGGRDGFIAKYSTDDGAFEWARSIGAEGADEVMDIAFDNTGNLFVIGAFEKTVDFVNEDAPNGADTRTAVGSRDYFIANYLIADAGLGWVFELGSTGDDLAGGAGGAIEVDIFGNVVVSGSFRGAVDFDPSPVESLLSTFAGADIFVSSYLPDGTRQWSTGIGGTGDDIASLQGLSVDLNGNIYLTGKVSGDNLIIKGYSREQGIFPGNQFSTTAGGDAFFAKLDGGDGNLEMAKCLSGNLSDAGVRIGVDNSGNIYITGTFQGTLDVDPSPVGTAEIVSPLIGTETSFFLAQYGNDGTFSWVSPFNSTSGVNSALGLDLDPLSGNSIICGRFHNTMDFDPSSGVDELVSGGDADIFVSEYDVLGAHLKKPASNCDSPTNITVSNIQTTTATIDWTPGQFVEEYVLEYRKIGDINYTKVTGILAPPQDIDQLIPNTDYEVHVRSKCGSDFSDFQPDPTKKFKTKDNPGCSKLLVATFGVTSTTVQFTWSPPSIGDYKVKWRKKGEPTFDQLAMGSGNPPFTLTGLASNTEYEAVMVYDCNGTDSPESDPVAFKTLPNLSCPTPSLSASNLTSTTADLLWSPSDSGFELNYKLSTSQTWIPVQGNGNIYKLINLADGKCYDARVRNRCGNDFSEFSVINQFCLPASGPCEKPKPFVTNIRQDRAEVVWFDTLDKYEIQYRLADSGSWIIWTNINFAPPFEFAGLNPGEEYEVRMRQICNGSFSKYSDTVRFRTLSEPCPTPEFKISGQTYTTIDVEWSPENTLSDTTVIMYSLVSDSIWKEIIVVGKNNTTITGLVNGTTYQIRAINKCGNSFISKYSKIQRVITDLYPTCEVPKFKVTVTDDQSVTLYWTQKLNEYEIEFRPVGDPDWNSIGDRIEPPFRVTGLLPYTDYEFRMKQICLPVENQSEFSEPIRGKTKLDHQCIKPTLTLMSVFPKYISLDWTPVENLYEISYKPVNGTNWINVYNNIAPPYTLVNLDPNVRYQIRLRNICGDDYSEYSDQVVFKTPLENNPCPTPEITLSNQTQTSVQVDWTPSAKIFEVTYREVGIFRWTRIARNAPGPMVITNLKPGKEYEIRVRNYCDEGYSYYSESDTIFTDPEEPVCKKPTLTFGSIDKRSVTVNFTPQMSSFEISYRRVDSAFVSSWTTIYSGDSSPYTINKLIPNARYEIRLRRFCQDLGLLSEYTDTLNVKTLPDVKPIQCDNPVISVVSNSIFTNAAAITWTGATLTTRIEIKAITGSVDTTWKTVRTSALPPYYFTKLIECTRYRVKVSNYCNGEFSTGAFLEFNTDCPPPPSCEKPEINLVGQTDKNISISWLNYLYNYEYSYRLKGTNDWVKNFDNIEPPLTITGLLADTTYEIRFRNYCEPEFSLYSNILTVRTEKYINSCAMPKNLKLTTVTPKTALLQWKRAPKATKHRIFYKIIGDDANVTAIVKEDFVWLAGLKPGRDYQFQVKSLCSDGGESEYTTTIYFKTPSIRENSSIDLEDINVYPIPNKGIFDVSIQSEYNNKSITIQVLDISGRLYSRTIHELTAGINKIPFDLNLAQGMYIMKISSDDTSRVIKIVIE